MSLCVRVATIDVAGVQTYFFPVATEVSANCISEPAAAGSI